MEKGSELGVKTAATTTMMMTAHRHERSNRAGRDHARELQGDEHDRELEGQAEERHHHQDQSQVRNGVVDADQVGTSDRAQPTERMGQGQVCGGCAQEEQSERGQHEGDGVAALRGPEAWRDEAPELKQDHRRGQDEAAEHGDLDPKRQPVERRGDEEVAGPVRRKDERCGPARVMPGRRVGGAEGPEQEVQDRLVGDDADGRRDDERARCTRRRGSGARPGAGRASCCRARDGSCVWS